MAKSKEPKQTLIVNVWYRVGGVEEGPERIAITPENLQRALEGDESALSHIGYKVEHRVGGIKVPPSAITKIEKVANRKIKQSMRPNHSSPMQLQLPLE